MRPKRSVFIATSLDGFIAREDGAKDGAMDWLDRANQTVTTGEDCGFADFMASVDALVMGRNSFELVSKFAEWPYRDTPLVVMSRRLQELPANVPATVSLSSQTPADLVTDLGAKGPRHLYIDGGLTIQSFLAAGLIDELAITTIPVLLGRGKPLFGALPHDLPLTHLSTRSFEFGFVQSRYRLGAVRSNSAS